MLKVGQSAPRFAAYSTHGRIDLVDYIGKQPIVLIFYPMDNSYVCTKQLCAVRDTKTEYDRLNAAVFGVNPAAIDSHVQFSSKNSYNFPIISDKAEQINHMYDVGRMVIRFIGQKRIVYVIDLAGKISYAKAGNPPSDEIVEAVAQAVR